MKKLILSVAFLGLIGLTNSAVAERKAKSTTLHCGCVVDEGGVANMRYSEISISSKSRGHDNHDVWTVDSCADANGDFFDFVRMQPDCLVADPNLRDPIAVCEEDFVMPPMAGDVCGNMDGAL